MARLLRTNLSELVERLSRNLSPSKFHKFISYFYISSLLRVMFFFRLNAQRFGMDFSFITLILLATLPIKFHRCIKSNYYLNFYKIKRYSSIIPTYTSYAKLFSVFIGNAKPWIKSSKTNLTTPFYTFISAVLKTQIKHIINISINSSLFPGSIDLTVPLTFLTNFFCDIRTFYSSSPLNRLYNYGLISTPFSLISPSLLIYSSISFYHFISFKTKFNFNIVKSLFFSVIYSKSIQCINFLTLINNSAAFCSTISLTIVDSRGKQRGLSLANPVATFLSNILYYSLRNLYSSKTFFIDSFFPRNDHFGIIGTRNLGSDMFFCNVHCILHRYLFLKYRFSLCLSLVDLRKAFDRFSFSSSSLLTTITPFARYLYIASSRFVKVSYKLDCLPQGCSISALLQELELVSLLRSMPFILLSSSYIDDSLVLTTCAIDMENLNSILCQTRTDGLKLE